MSVFKIVEIYRNISVIICTYTLYIIMSVLKIVKNRKIQFLPPHPRPQY